LLGKGKAQIRPPLLDAADDGAAHHGFEATANGFDFREFRHGFRRDLGP
jgi:hypothetical protein